MTLPADEAVARPPRPVLRFVALAAACLLIVAFTGLGIWQVQRLQWKTDLIQRVDARLAAPYETAPGADAWPQLNERDDEYRRIEAVGEFIDGHDTLVKAVTELGGGFWVMTPFVTRDGFRVLVNRGFVSNETASGDIPAAREGETEVRGLLRMSQPGGAFLRDNDPEGGRWFSRDTAAIAVSEGIAPVAPYFMDAEASGPGEPVGGLTVVHFRNTHLVYALTWFSLAVLLAGAVAFISLKRGRTRL